MRALIMLALGASLGAQQPRDSVAAHAAFVEGRDAVNTRRTDAAVTLLERAVALDPTQWEYHMWLGHAYVQHINRVNFMRKMSVGKRMGAEYDKAVELAPRNAEAGDARIGFYLNAPGIVGGGMDKAEAESKRIASFDPYRGALASARVAERAKNVDRAEREYRDMMRQYPDSSVPVFMLAQLLQANKRYDDAFAVLDARLAKVPNDTLNVFQVGRLASTSGQQLQRGEQALRRYLGLVGGQAPLREANGHYWLGTVREKLGDANDALAEYRRAVALNAGHEQAAAAVKRLEQRR